MAIPVDFDDDLAVKQREIREVLEAQKRVLAAVALPHPGDSRFQRLLRLRHIGVEPVPVS